MIILDGPMGTELAFRGIETRLPLWSAGALESDPGAVESIHRAHVAAGAQVVTTNTFRTSKTTSGDRWQEYTDRAVELARHATDGTNVRVAGSIAPLADCYRPDLSPAVDAPEHTFREHRRMAERLAPGCDVLLCETFPSVEEAVLAVRAAVTTGKTTWVALTAGPGRPLLTPTEMGRAAERLVDEGASALLVSCTPATDCIRYVEALAGKGAMAGAYANAGVADEETGFRSDPEVTPRRYLEFAKMWRSAGAEIIGGCCGTRPQHIESLAGLEPA